MAPGRVVLLATAFVCAACSGSGTTGGTVKDPPQVFLSALKPTTIDRTLKVRANVAGCDKVRGIEILHGQLRLITVDTPAAFPGEIELGPTLFRSLYNSLGLALKLNLRARGVCEDGRENESTGLGMSFFPVESVVPPAVGNTAALPDVFVAEGGAGATPTTFLGCVSTGQTTALARFDTAANVISIFPPEDQPSIALPLPCTYNASISDKNAASGLRWLFEPGVGIMSFDSRPNFPLTMVGLFKQKIPNMGVGPDGDAIVWTDTVPAPLLYRIGRDGTVIWQVNMSGMMLGAPVVSQNEVRIITWTGMLGEFSGTVRVMRFRYDTGMIIAQNALATIEYGEFDDPIRPAATFNRDGSLVYFAFQNAGSDRTRSAVIACASDGVSCFSGSSSWQSPLLDAVILAAIPFANGAYIAAVGHKKTFFLSATTGQVVNVFNAPIKPDGTLLTTGVQAGNGTDFYLLNAQAGGYPTEIIAIDSPQNGELWRTQIEGGQTPATSMNLAVDEGNNVWLRVGPNLVRPNSLLDYRTLKGTNQAPPDGGG